MSAVRATIDTLHSNETGGTHDCVGRNPQPAFAVSNFDTTAHVFDELNEHRIDFMTNRGGPLSDDAINVVASGAAIDTQLKGQKSWTAQPSGAHCDAIKTAESWDLLRAGAGFQWAAGAARRPRLDPQAVDRWRLPS